jgi:hypothetical protein
MMLWIYAGISNMLRSTRIVFVFSVSIALFHISKLIHLGPAVDDVASEGG